MGRVACCRVVSSMCELAFIIIMSWHIYLFWGFCIIILTELIRHPLNIGELLVSCGITLLFVDKRQQSYMFNSL